MLPFTKLINTYDKNTMFALIVLQEMQINENNSLFGFQRIFAVTSVEVVVD